MQKIQYQNNSVFKLSLKRWLVFLNVWFYFNILWQLTRVDNSDSTHDIWAWQLIILQGEVSREAKATLKRIKSPKHFHSRNTYLLINIHWFLFLLFSRLWPTCFEKRFWINFTTFWEDTSTDHIIEEYCDHIAITLLTASKIFVYILYINMFCRKLLVF